ncbi:DUF4328 domain-containing protein [Streptomyces sp. NPDC035033]|uniref:DUF4328 domain-containing protein n=1 Tax=Streptomyces sp. NPDC035033 TaxID=3155368 RepID=UPI0033C26F95
MLRNPNGLAHAVTALLGVNVFLDLLGAGVELWTLSDPEEAYEAGAFAGVNLVALSLADIGAYLATIVLFLVWFHRVRRNADVWALDIQSRTPGWAIGAWFIPIANLWIPRAIAADIWRASRQDPYASDGAREMALLNSWWAFWVAGAVTDQVASRMYSRAETLDAWTTAAAWSLAGYLFTIAAGVLAILFVRRLTSMQHAKATGMLSAAR